MVSLLTSLSRYLLDTRQDAYPGLPHTSDGSDPYLKELLSLYPADVYPGGIDFELPEGQVRAWRFGPTDSKKGRILLVHGLSMPSIIWKPTAEALAEAGYEVALFDVFGRGYSSAPRGDYQISLYVNQVLGVLDKLGWSEPFYLAGLSMGGPICSAFTALFPERVKKVALLAPAAYINIVDQITEESVSELMHRPLKWPLWTSPFHTMMLQVPWKGSAISWPIRRAYSRKSTPLDVPLPPADSSDRLERIVALEYCTLQGFAAAVAKSLRHGPIFDYRKPYIALSKTVDIDILVIWGTDDDSVPYSLSWLLMSILGSRAMLHTIEGGSHDLPTVDHAETTKALLSFFR